MVNPDQRKHRLRACKHLLVLLASMTLLACAMSQPQPPAGSATIGAAEALTQWSLKGKVGLQSAAGAQSAYLNWQEQSPEFAIRLSGPFGMGAVHIHGDQQSVTLEQAGKPPRQAASANELLSDALGWSAPIEHLRYWVRGIPAQAPIEALALHDDQRSIRTLVQQGWQVEFLRYQQVGGLVLPARFRVSKGDLALTMVISDWQI